MFSLAQHHKYSFYDIDNLIPFERDLYCNMIIAHINEVSSQNAGIPANILSQLGGS